jgi:hypothetical protein
MPKPLVVKAALGVKVPRVVKEVKVAQVGRRNGAGLVQLLRVDPPDKVGKPAARRAQGDKVGKPAARRAQGVKVGKPAARRVQGVKVDRAVKAARVGRRNGAGQVLLLRVDPPDKVARWGKVDKPAARRVQEVRAAKVLNADLVVRVARAGRDSGLREALLRVRALFPVFLQAHHQCHHRQGRDLIEHITSSQQYSG